MAKTKKTSESPAGQSETGSLVELIEQLNPYLDSFGHAYCGGLGRDAKGKSGWPLDSEQVLSLITFRYHNLHSSVPSRIEIEAARRIVVGGLWDQRRIEARTPSPHSTVVKLILKHVETQGDFLGTASEAEAELREVANNHPECLLQGESLDISPTQMGVILGQMGLILRDKGVELYRPPRRDVKRLWAWRRISACPDTPDTPDTRPQGLSGTATGHEETTSGPHDATDTTNGEHLHLMETYHGALNHANASA